MHLWRLGHAAARSRLQRQGEHESGQESTYVSPPGHTAPRGRLNGQHLETSEELNQEPIPQEKQGGEFDRPEKEKEWDEGGNARGGERDKVGAKNSGNGATGANRGHTRRRVEQDVEKVSPEASEEIDGQEFQMAETVFDAPTENKQEQHVSQQMEPPSMQEHGRKKRNQRACWGCAPEVV